MRIQILMRLILIIIFSALSILFLLIGFIANFVNMRHRIVTYQNVKISTKNFLFFLLSACLLLIIYDINSWVGAVVILLMGLSLMGMGLIIAYLSFHNLRKREAG